MSWRFRKSVKLLPGFRLNIGKRGASFSAGTRGARVTMGGKHVTTSVGMPGTGLSHVSRTQRGATPEELSDAETPESSGGSRDLAYGILFIIALIGLAKLISWFWV